MGCPVLDPAVWDALGLAAARSDAIRRIAHHSIHHLRVLLIYQQIIVYLGKLLVHKESQNV